MLAMMLQDLQCLGKLVVPVAVVAPVEMRMVWVARVPTVTEELPVVVEDPGCACVCLVMLVLRWSCECATGSVWRRTTR